MFSKLILTLSLWINKFWAMTLCTKGTLKLRHRQQFYYSNCKFSAPGSTLFSRFQWIVASSEIVTVHFDPDLWVLWFIQEQIPGIAAPIKFYLFKWKLRTENCKCQRSLKINHACGCTSKKRWTISAFISPGGALNPNLLRVFSIFQHFSLNALLLFFYTLPIWLKWTSKTKQYCILMYSFNVLIYLNWNRIRPPPIFPSSSFSQLPSLKLLPSSPLSNW